MSPFSTPAPTSRWAPVTHPCCLSCRCTLHSHFLLCRCASNHSHASPFSFVSVCVKPFACLPTPPHLVSLLGPDSTRAPLPRQPATARTPARASLPLTTALLRARPLPTHHAPRSAPTQISSVTPHPEHGPDPNLLQDSASTFIPRTHASPRSAFGSGPRAQPTRHGPNSDSAPQAAPLPLTTWSRPHKRPPL